MVNELEKRTPMHNSMERKVESVPELLYKFRHWKGKNGEDHPYDQSILTHRIVRFSSPAEFNDPFDCRIPFRYDLMPKKDQFRKAYEIARRKFPIWDDKRLKVGVQRELELNPLFSKDAELAMGAQADIFQFLATSFGVLSLAGNRESMLMWSHYADSHRGYCVALDGKALAYRLFGLLLKDKEAIDSCKVQYGRDLPIVIPTADEEVDRERYRSLLSSKSQDWAYEEEYRFIYVGKTRLSRGIKRDAIKRVIFGCQMPPEHRMEIADIVHTTLPKAELWEAVRSNDEFKLDFRPWKADGSGSPLSRG